MESRRRIDPRRAHRPTGRAGDLTDRFYDWEKRGRGWRLWDQPVELEPPFQTFLSHSPAPMRNPIDDGRKLSLLGQLAGAMSRRIVPAPRTELLGENSHEYNALPKMVAPAGPVVERRVAVPPALKVKFNAAENFLLSLAHGGQFMAFELIGVEDSVCVQFVARDTDRSHLVHQVSAHFPESAGTDQSSYLKDKWVTEEARDLLIVDFGLSHEFMLPVRVASTLDPDPLVSVIGTLDDLRAGEVGVYQVLFQATRHPWPESVLRSVTDAGGKPFFANAPEMLKLAKQKVSRPLFAVVIRAAARSPIAGRSAEIVRNLAGGLRQFSSPPHNEFIPLQNNDYSNADHARDLVARATRRSGMLLNSEELASLVHPPSASVQCSKLIRQITKTRAAPAIVSGHRLVIGDNCHAGRTTACSLGEPQRMRHTAMWGATGSGKSWLTANMFLQDIQVTPASARPSMFFIDPYGETADEILARIPEHLHEYVVLIDLADVDWSVPLNVLEARSEVERTVLGSELVGAFRAQSTSWGDQMTVVLGNAFSAFLESDRGGTLLDLRHFLIDPAFRRAFLKTVRDPQVVYFWEKEFPLLAGRGSGKPQASLLVRLDSFLRPKTVRYSVAQQHGLDIDRLMNQPMITIVRTALGVVGAENAYLFGSFFMSKIHQHAMGRQALEESQRRPCFLYIDEAQNLCTPAMAALLSSVRKYRLGLVLVAGQDLKQYSRDPEILNSILSNPCTRVCFRVGDDDARKLEGGFSHFDSRDLQNLGIGEAICRVERADHDFNLKTRPLPFVDPEVARRRRERIVEMSRRKYATPVAEIEAAIRRSMADGVRVVSVSGGARNDSENAPPAGATPVVSEPAATPQGRGGKQHRYLQHLIKRGAERFGYRATIEKPVLNGLGSVDVALEREGQTIACEVSSTSTPAQELSNIRKCLSAGFDLIVTVSADQTHLSETSSRAAMELGPDELDRVRFLTPDQLLTLLDQRSGKEGAGSARTRGYRVEAVRIAVDDAERRHRSDTLLQLMRAVAQQRRGVVDEEER